MPAPPITTFPGLEPAAGGNCAAASAAITRESITEAPAPATSVFRNVLRIIRLSPDHFFARARASRPAALSGVPLQSGGLHGRAHIGWQQRRDEPIPVAPPLQFRLERLAQAVFRLKHAPGAGHRDGCFGGDRQLVAHGIDDVRELPRGALQERERGLVALLCSGDDEPGELRELAALRRQLAVDGGAEIEVARAARSAGVRTRTGSRAASGRRSCARTVANPRAPASRKSLRR